MRQNLSIQSVEERQIFHGQLHIGDLDWWSIVPIRHAQKTQSNVSDGVAQPAQAHS